MYYDIKHIYGYDKLFNFIVGARGIGKTYSAKTNAIDIFLETGKQFIYLRRFKEEIKKVKKKFVADIVEKYPNTDFKINGDEILINKEVAGYFVSLSTSKIDKSVSYHNVNTIIFDEFILDKGFYRYIPDEVVNFLEFYETTARLRDVKVFFLSNALTMTNPYFSFFKLILPQENSKTGITTKKDILLELCKNEDFKSVKKETRFAKIVEGTRYYNYAIDNDFLRDTNYHIAKKTGTSKHMFNLTFLGTRYGVWYDNKSFFTYVSKNYDQQSKFNFSLNREADLQEERLIANRGNLFIKHILKSWHENTLFFESVDIKNNIINFINYL